MGSPIPPSPDPTDSSSTYADPIPEVPRRRPRIKKRRRLQPATLYGFVFAAIVLVVILVQFAVHMARTDPRDSRLIAQRELEVNSLQPGEHVIRAVSVFKRPAISYFRATRGLLALTDKRLLYLGLEPRDLLAAPDLPPTFEERDFPLDTTVKVSAGRTFFGIAKAVVIETPEGTLRLGVPSGSWPQADLIVAGMEGRHNRAVAQAKQQREFLAKAEAQRKTAEAQRLKPKYYTVRRGDAMGSIATIWNTTPEKLRGWNKLANDRIRVGQVLMVRPAL